MKTKSRNNKIKRTLLKPLQLLLILLLIGIIFVILKSIYSMVQDQQNIKRSIESLQEEVKKFDQENNDLNKLVEYFNSEEYQEKEAKEKLNLVKKGEQVVFIQGSINNNDSSNSNQSESKVITSRANYYYWWKYFFGGV